MTGYVLSPEAEEDIFEIWSYLAKEAGIEFAKRQELTRIPVLFFRAFPHPHTIIYRPKTPLEVVGVLHAKRKVKRILKSRQEV